MVVVVVVEGGVTVHKVNQLSRGNLRGEIELFLSSTPQRALKYTHHLKCNLPPSFADPRTSLSLENTRFIRIYILPAKMAGLSIKPILRNGLGL